MFSAFGYPQDVVPVVRSVAKQQNPLVVLDVGGSSPGRIIAKNFHIPSASQGVFNFLLDGDSVAIEVASVGLGGLVDVVDGGGLLLVGDALAVGTEDRLDQLAGQ